jgi:hypothetical protein
MPVSPCPQSEGTICLPGVSILRHLPNNGTMQTQASPAQNVHIPLSVIIPQLRHGRIQVSLGQLRQWCSPGSFAETPDADSLLVDLPLGEVLSRIDPALYARRVQIPFHVPMDIPNMFFKKTACEMNPPGTSESGQAGCEPLSPKGA